jgi:hypothetical protein
MNWRHPGPEGDFITLWEVPRFARNDDWKMNEGRGGGSKSDNWRPSARLGQVCFILTVSAVPVGCFT